MSMKPVIIHRSLPDKGILRQSADAIAEQLAQAGFDALFVGGCVRDLLLNQSPKDYDIVTNKATNAAKLRVVSAIATYLFVAKSLMVLMLNAAFNNSASPSLIP